MSIIYPVANPRLKPKSISFVEDCVSSHWVSSSGKYLDQFQTAFSEKFGPGTSICVSNGTIAIELALIALGIGPGDEVLVPNFTFVGSVSPIYRVHATPVLVKPTPDGWNMDPVDLEKKITNKTKAIIAVHLYGHPCDILTIKAISNKHKLLLIEDSAEALGATVNGQFVGTFGDVGCFSFFGNKVLTTGEGGLCITQNPETAEKINIYKNHGMRPDERYWHRVIGYNGRMTNLQAAVGLGQVLGIDEDLNIRKDIEKRYFDTFNKTEFFQNVPLPSGAEPVNWLTSPLIKENMGIDRDQLMADLLQQGIDSRPFFYPISCMPAFSRFGENDPTSLSVSARGLNLPTYIDLKIEEVDIIANAVVQSCERQHRQNGACHFPLRLPQKENTLEPPKVSIILPTLNPGLALVDTAKTLRSEMIKISHSFELVIIDDGSNDGSLEKLQEELQHDPNLRIHIRTGKIPSLGQSLMEGLELAKGEILLFLDANGNHDAKVSSQLVKNSQDFDIVSASRFTTGGTCSDPKKHWLSKNFNRAIRLTLGIPTRDNTSSYYCIKKTRLWEIDPASAFQHGANAFFHLILRAHRRQWSILEIPTVSHQAFHWPPSPKNLTRLKDYSLSAINCGLKRLFP